jgi:cytidine deaminase
MLTENQIQELKETAEAASRRAYCPYSDFPVGAAVLTKSGLIVPGCNVEIASYGLTICAERNAVFSAVARGEREIAAVGIYTPTPTPTAPCGACRQVIYEFGKKTEVFSFCESSEISSWKIEELLPAAFGPRDLDETQ